MQTEPLAQGPGWKRYSEGSFAFEDRGQGFMLKLRNTKREDGHVYADCIAYYTGEGGTEPIKMLVRPRVNLTSDRAGGLGTLRKKVEERWASENLPPIASFDLFMENVCSVLVEQMHRKGVLRPLHPLSGPELAQPMAFKGMLPLDRVSALVAHGGKGKSLTALMMCLAVATGRPIGPFSPLIQGPVIYLDWEEEDELTHSRRMTRLCAGAGLEFPSNVLHYHARADLWHAEDELMELAFEHGAVFIVADSIAFALGDSVNKDEPMTAALGVLKRLPGTKLVIAHVAKARVGAAEDNPELGGIGTVFFRNGVRGEYTLRAGEVHLDGTLPLTLVNDKANLTGRSREPIEFDVHFEDPDGPVVVTRRAMDPTRPGWASLSWSARALYGIKHSGFQPTMPRLRETLGIEPKTSDDASLVRTLQDLIRRKQVYRFGEGPGTWFSLAADVDERMSEPPPDAPFRAPERDENRIGDCAVCGGAAYGYDAQGREVCNEHLEG